MTKNKNVSDFSLINLAVYMSSFFLLTLVTQSCIGNPRSTNLTVDTRDNLKSKGYANDQEANSPGSQKTYTVGIDIAKNEYLKTSEIETVRNLVATGLKKTGNYIHMDMARLNRMIADESWPHVLEGDKNKLREIEKKYQVDVIVRISASVESKSGIGGYYLSAANVTMACLRTNAALLFNEKVNETQSGFHGIPEYIGLTNLAARQAALSAAIADIFQQAGFNTVAFPAPVRIDLALNPVIPPSSTVFIKEDALPNPEQIRKDIIYEMGERAEISCAIQGNGLDGRLGGIAVLTKEFDLQRGRRIDTAKIQIVHVKKKQFIKELILPQKANGVRRAKSKKIIDFAFGPAGRFLAVLSEHPQIWIYDIWNGTLLLQYFPGKKVTSESIEFSKNGKYININQGKFFYKLSKNIP